jgi:hypothetical protein
MTSFLFRPPQFPIILFWDEEAVTAANIAEFERLVQSQSPVPQPDQLMVVVDSRWEGFAYFPDLDAVSPICVKKEWTKRELIDAVNARTNRSDDETSYSSSSLSNKTRRRVFEDLVDIIRLHESTDGRTEGRPDRVVPGDRNPREGGFRPQ